MEILRSLSLILLLNFIVSEDISQIVQSKSTDLSALNQVNDLKENDVSLSDIETESTLTSKLPDTISTPSPSDKEGGKDPTVESIRDLVFIKITDFEFKEKESVVSNKLPDTSTLSDSVTEGGQLPIVEDISDHVSIKITDDSLDPDVNEDYMNEKDISNLVSLKVPIISLSDTDTTSNTPTVIYVTTETTLVADGGSTSREPKETSPASSSSSPTMLPEMIETTTTVTQFTSKDTQRPLIDLISKVTSPPSKSTASIPLKSTSSPPTTELPEMIETTPSFIHSLTSQPLKSTVSTTLQSATSASPTNKQRSSTPPSLDNERSAVSLEEVCQSVSVEPNRYLRPHPTDCNKFISCQWLGGNRFRPHVMVCPPTVGFDGGLMICNFNVCGRRP